MSCKRLSRKPVVLIEEFLPRTIAQLGRAYRRSDQVEECDRGQEAFSARRGRRSCGKFLDRRIDRLWIDPEPGGAHVVGLSGKEADPRPRYSCSQIAHGFGFRDR